MDRLKIILELKAISQNLLEEWHKLAEDAEPDFKVQNVINNFSKNIYGCAHKIMKLTEDLQNE